MRAQAILGEIARVVHPAEGSFDLSGFENVVDAIVSIITRHPMNEAELRHTLEKWTPGQVDKALEELSSSGRAQVVERYGTRFWSASPAHYPQRSSANPETLHSGRKGNG